VLGLRPDRTGRRASRSTLADGDGLSLDLIDEDRRRVERGGITAFEIDHDPGDVWAAGRS